MHFWGKISLDIFYCSLHYCVHVDYKFATELAIKEDTGHYHESGRDTILNASTPSFTTPTYVSSASPGGLATSPDPAHGLRRDHPLPGPGLVVPHYFTHAGVHPYDEVVWEKRLALIAGEDGRPVFEQRDVEFPQPWSQLATNVVASKYFRGPLGTPQREHSVRQVLDRVVQTITAWGQRGGYFATDNDAAVFADELTYLLLHQMAAFNSPVWFNVGVEERPQASACFIIAV